jgi:hypothetical protein
VKSTNFRQYENVRPNMKNTMDGEQKLAGKVGFSALSGKYFDILNILREQTFIFENETFSQKTNCNSRQHLVSFMKIFAKTYAVNYSDIYQFIKLLRFSRKLKKVSFISSLLAIL